MDKLKIFNILGIPETKDKDLIKNTYRTKLVTIHPEDNPEEFKELRTAFELATKLCDESSETDNSTDNSPLGLWISQVMDIYRSFNKRIDVNCWKTLFEHDICTDFDTYDEAGKRLLTFLMDNYRLPMNVFKLINDTFNFTDNINELEEYFPKNFLSFYEYQVHNDQFIDYNLFEGDDTAEYDIFISEYFSLKDKIDAGNYDDFETDYKNILIYDIYHPYLDVERLRVAIEGKQLMDCKDIEEKLASNYKDNIYIRYYLMLLKWENEDYETAYKDIQYLLEVYPNHYSAKNKLMHYYFIKEDYNKSKEESLNILDVYTEDENALEIMKKSNEFLIETFKESLQDNPDSIDSILELSWCLYQNEKFDECLEYLNSITIDENHILDYNNLKGRNYVAMNRYEEALPHLQTWQRELENLVDDGSTDYWKKKRRYGLARYLQALSYDSLANKLDKSDNNAKDKQSMEYKEKALAILDFDIDAWDDMNIRLASHNIKANILLNLGQNEKCIDVCYHILSINNNYFPAYVNLQEAYFILKDGQQVIDNFYKAVEIYPHFVKIYLLAAKVYYYYKQYDDSLKIINMAREKELKSNDLDLCELRCIRYNAQTNEQTSEALELCRKLIEKINNNKEDNDIRDISEVFLEEIYGYMDLDNYTKALNGINDVLKKFPGDTDNYALKARILNKLDKYSEAMNIFKAHYKSFKDDYYFIYDMAICHEGLKEYDEALEKFKRVLEIYPEHSTANDRISNIYRTLYLDKWDKKYFKFALKYATDQLETRLHCYYLIERGLIYSDAYMFEEAIADYEAAIVENPESIYAYNNLGLAYHLQGKNDKAIEMYQKSIELNHNNETTLPYVNLGNTYMAKHEYDNALKAYLKCQELFPDRTWYRKITNALRAAGKHDEAIRIFHKELIKGNKDDAKVLYFRIAETYEEKGDLNLAKKYFKKQIKADTSDADSYIDMGNFYFLSKEDNKKALSNYIKAYELSSKKKTSTDYLNSCRYLLRLYYTIGNTTEVNEMFNKLIDYFNQRYGSIDKALDNPSSKPYISFQLFCIHYFSGHMDMAEKYKDILLNLSFKCDHCESDKCVDAYIAKGYYLEYEGNIKGAIEAFEIALQEDINRVDVKYKLRNLKKLL